MFTVRGQPHHLIGPLNAEQQDRARFAQIYFIGDSEIQFDARAGLYLGLRRHSVETLQSFIEENNAIFREFQTAMERMPATANRIVMHSEIVPAGDHQGRYNPQIIDEPAILMVDGETGPRDNILKRWAGPNNSDHQRINENNPFYDAFQYPMLLIKDDHECSSSITS